MSLMVDLFAGFGGQSEAFHQCERWQVLRLDNNPLLNGVENMVTVDVKNLQPHSSAVARIEYFHASPPCTEFSRAYAAIAPTMQREGKEFQPDMSLIIEALRIKDALAPRWWSLENVKGSIPFIEPILGPPRQIIGSYVYWGNFPEVKVDVSKLRTKAQKDKRHAGPLRANHRAHVDFEISRAFKEAIEAQTTLFMFQS
jgi:hypothetical protein